MPAHAQDTRPAAEKRRDMDPSDAGGAAGETTHPAMDEPWGFSGVGARKIKLPRKRKRPRDGPRAAASYYCSYSVRNSVADAARLRRNRDEDRLMARWNRIVARTPDRRQHARGRVDRKLRYVVRALIGGVAEFATPIDRDELR